MNTARNRHASDLALELSQRSTDDLTRIMTARDPARPSRYLHPVTLRRTARHVLMARAITAPAADLGNLRAAGAASAASAARLTPGQAPVRRWRLLVWTLGRRRWVHYFTADGRNRAEALRCVRAQGFHFLHRSFRYTADGHRRWVLARFYREAS